MNYLHLIRYKNLLFIAAFQILMYFCIVIPTLETFRLENLALSSGIFSLLLVSTLCIAAGGFVINDYFDTRIDQLNRPKKVLVGVSITKRTASLLHQILTIIGILAGLAVAYTVKSWNLAIIIVILPGALWFYSASYKRQFLLGNIILALMAALIPILPAITQGMYSLTVYGDLIQQTPINAIIIRWSGGFAAFAFLIIFTQSIFKNIASEYGDREMESRTIPIVLGNNKTKFILYILLFAAIGLSVGSYFCFIKDFPLFNNVESSLPIRYILCGIVLPVLILIYLLIKAKSIGDYRQAASFCGFILILGMLFSLVYYFLLAKAQGIPMFGTFIIQ